MRLPPITSTMMMAKMHTAAIQPTGMPPTLVCRARLAAVSLATSPALTSSTKPTTGAAPGVGACRHRITMSWVGVGTGRNLP